MIYEALLVPSESPPTLSEIKRALLTYDKVILIDPSDRGLIPNESYMSAVMRGFLPGLPFGAGLHFDVGPIRPMGKSLGYDDKFQKTLEACAPAGDRIEVRSTYRSANELKAPAQGVSGFKLGFVDTGGYPVHIPDVYWTYREMASIQPLLRAALGPAGGKVQDALAELSVNPEFVITNAMGDGVMNNVPGLPALELPDGVEPELMKQLGHLARARIGAFIKYTGYCEAKALVPVFPTDAYGGIAGQLTVAARDLFAAVNDPFWTKRNRVLKLAYEEYLEDDYLGELEIEQILKLRTKAWGRQGDAREKLFESIFTIANEIDDSSKFDDEAAKAIKECYQESADLLKERQKLNAGVRASMVEGAMLLASSPAIHSFVQGLLPSASIWATMALGGIWLTRKWERYRPQVIELQAKEAAMKRGAGIGLHNFFSKVSK
jgi:hypothetical protein